MKRRVLIELKQNQQLQRSFEASMSEDSSKSKISNKIVGDITGFDLDDSFSAVAVPNEMMVDPSENEQGENLYDTEAGVEYDYNPSSSTYIVRGEVEEKNLVKFEKDAKSKSNVIGVYADPVIEPCIICPGSPPLGTDSTVKNLLNVSQLNKCGYNGKGVRVAIVDTGVNMNYLRSKGVQANFDAANSWKPSSSTVTPGSAPIGHGTMCAFDVSISAPHCTLLDIALLTTTRRSGQTIMDGFLSDAILAYRHLINVQLNTSPRPGVNKSLVVNNSWGMFHPSWDFPVGHPGNYSDNPNHPFNRIVRSLERQGADILFAAGNCGANCPDGRCRGVTTRTIYGANSSPYVLTIGGVDTTKNRVGYSSMGPGRISNRKPDVCGYTHFAGSGVYSADGGTSAACPVVAGMVAAIRTKRPFNPLSSSTRPSAIRNFVRATAQDLGPTGFDYQTGYGVINGHNIAKRLKCYTISSICDRFPWICKPPYNFCKRHPEICNPKIRRKPRIRLPQNENVDQEVFYENNEEITLNASELMALEQYLTEHFDEMTSEPETEKSDCGCSK